MGPLNPVWGTGIAARPCPPSYLFSLFSWNCATNFIVHAAPTENGVFEIYYPFPSPWDPLRVPCNPCRSPASALQKQYSRNSSCTYTNMQRPILLTAPKKLLLWLLLQVCHKSFGSSNAR